MAKRSETPAERRARLDRNRKTQEWRRVSKAPSARQGVTEDHAKFFNYVKRELTKHPKWRKDLIFLAEEFKKAA